MRNLRLLALCIMKSVFRPDTWENTELKIATEISVSVVLGIRIGTSVIEGSLVPMGDALMLSFLLIIL